MADREPLSFGLYLHIPFCRHRCPYCDFNTYAGLEAWMLMYVQALISEMAWVREQYGEPPPVDTVYFGGGTPTLLPLPLWETLFDALHRHFYLHPQAEITVEANPEGLSLALLRGLRFLGVNRLSLGMQAAHPQDLRILGRQHDFTTVVRSVALARRAGFTNLNLDLMFGLPYQPLERWQDNLEWALRLAPDHLSCYALTLEYGTPLQAWVARGRLPQPDDDLAADMYAWAMERLDRAGFQQYELSNWSRPGRACRHNLKYWQLQPYLGLGAGAHGFVRGVRTANVRAPQAYVQRLRHPPSRPAHPFPWTPATVSWQPLSLKDRVEELMFMGLRLVETGVEERHFRTQTGLSLRQVYQERLEPLVVQGLLEWYSAGLRLTYRGRFLANRVFVDVLDPPLPSRTRAVPVALRVDSTRQ